MRLLLSLPASLVALAVVAGASHLPDCTIYSADPASYHTLAVPGSGTYYVQERDGVFTPVGPVPLSGFFVGNGTWVYEESNGIPGMQPGSVCGFSGCGGCFPNDDLCIILDIDPIHDDYCGHGPDRLIL